MPSLLIGKIAPTTGTLSGTPPGGDRKASGAMIRTGGLVPVVGQPGGLLP